MTNLPVMRVLTVVILVALAGCGGAGFDAVVGPDQAAAETAESPTPSPDAVESPNGTLEVHFINVGQGASTLVVGPSNETMLIDSGDWSDDGEDVLSYLEERGIDRIDYLVTTHADADHIGGHAAVIEHFETEGEGVGAVYDPGITSSSQTYGDYLDAVEEHDVTLYETRAGDTIPFEGVETTVLLPPEEYVANGDRNENSIAVHLGFGASSFLLPGDTEDAGEEYLVDEYGASLNATVLQAGHHGSRSSSSDAFLDESQPRIALITSGYDSQYGHPHEEVLQRFADRGVETYWTATHGNVRMTSNGSAVTVATQRAAPTDPLELREGDAVEPGSTDDLQVRTVLDVSGGTTSPVATDGGTTPTTESATTESQTATESPSDSSGSDEGEAGALSVATIHEDAAGDEYENLNDEYVVFENTGEAALDLSGWTVRDEADHTYTFPEGVTLDVGAQVTLRTGSGTDDDADLYWGADAPVWNNGGDTVVVQDDDGATVLEEEY
ncbi:competence protein ComEC [Halomicrobium zhouii]|uniref:Competence protein ComEC n=1 Tax=Halomicrobium zhouii TaxID=767519 RepID=A0A1I6KZT7_9EURY|nr:lamin tail domain-containing protein [Halomicrobium zhouii]SFR96739.1 competence protein ComEC [Halomicrobium zhouii]